MTMTHLYSQLSNDITYYKDKDGLIRFDLSKEVFQELELTSRKYDHLLQMYTLEQSLTQSILVEQLNLQKQLLNMSGLNSRVKTEYASLAKQYNVLQKKYAMEVDVTSSIKFQRNIAFGSMGVLIILLFIMARG